MDLCLFAWVSFSFMHALIYVRTEFMNAKAFVLIQKKQKIKAAKLLPKIYSVSLKLKELALRAQTAFSFLTLHCINFLTVRAWRPEVFKGRIQKANEGGSYGAQIIQDMCFLQTDGS